MKKTLLILLLSAAGTLSAQKYSYQFFEKCTRIHQRLRPKQDYLSPPTVFYRGTDDSQMTERPRNHIILRDGKSQFRVSLERNNNILALLGVSLFSAQAGEEAKLVETQKMAENSYVVRVFKTRRKTEKPFLTIGFMLKKSEYPLVSFSFLDSPQIMHTQIFSALRAALPDEKYQVQELWYGYDNNRYYITEKFIDCTPVDYKITFKMQ